MTTRFTTARRRCARSAAITVALAGALVAGSGVARAAQAGPTVFAYPSPGVKTASPLTQISFRGVAPAALGPVRVVGTRSGRHSGRVVAHSDGRGASFLPARRFRARERVTVTGGFAIAGAGRRPYSFRIARFAANPPLNRRMGRTPASGTRALVSRPDLRPPAWDVRTARPEAAGTGIVVGPKLLATRRGQDGAQILSGSGRTRLWWPLPRGQKPFDVRVQTLGGRPVLTFWQGYMSLGQGTGHGVIVDARYRVLQRVRMGNGYGMDLHEFRLSPRGTALVMAYQAVRYDTRSAGGSRDGIVTDGVIQEIDLATGLVLFEWHSLGNVALRESTRRRPPAGRRIPWDYFHPNSAAFAGDAGILISARHTDAVYLVDRATGRIVWRLGGMRSDFRLGPGASFARQHDAEMQPDATIRIFDNSDRRGRARSRVITLRLDPGARRATLVRALGHPRRTFAGTQGNAQPLAGGASFVNWGSRGGISEFDASGRLLFDAWLPRGWDSYRGYTAEWVGAPLTAPRAAARAAGAGTTRVYASWNGATEIASWRLFAGPQPGALGLVGAVPWQDLETSVRVGSAAPFWVVQALDAGGGVLGTSAVVRRRA